MSDLVQKHCVPCEGGTLPLQEAEVKRLFSELGGGWELKEGKLTQEFKFHDFKSAMEFVSRVADIAEKEWHHPDIFISFNKVRLELFTHAIKGLSENDFIVAAKINQISLPLHNK